jgi:hypothetical protein
MANEKISVEELLSSQSKSSCSATVEAVEGQPDLVKITPWTAAAGCLCHLAVNIPKASLAGVTPTGDTHVCCGKTLKVVELHFKKGESITLEELFSQLHRSASKSTHESGSGATEPFYELGHTPPGYGEPRPPSGLHWPPIRPITDPWQKRSLYASGHAWCIESYDNCLSRCQHSYDPWCSCRCRQSNAICLGHPITPCP